MPVQQKFEIRESTSGDSAAVESIYPGAFPDENLVPLIRDLMRDSDVATSLIAVKGSQIIAHAMFTMCSLDRSSAKIALLGPLAVAAAWQRKGVGSEIVRAGIQRLVNAGVSVVCVLGDPAYYGRFGFEREALITPPYRLPDEWREAWQSCHLHDVPQVCAGKLAVPRQWDEPALWAP